MADLRLNILGDGASATVALNKVQAGVLALGKELASFAKDSVRAFEEQEAADRKLALVAGEATEAFKRQASVIQANTGVSDDMVQEMQRMLLTYGEAPAEIDKTIKAILNMTAATGGDAVQAVSELTTHTTTGRKAFVELGVEYERTGTRSEVLAAATAALGAKFAGASESDINTLSGQVRLAKSQFGELQETFGGFIATIAAKTGVIDSLAKSFGFLNEILNPDATTRRSDAVQRMFDLEKGIAEFKGKELSESEATKLTALRHELVEAKNDVAALDNEVKKVKASEAAAGRTTGAADGLRAGNKKDKGDDAEKELEKLIKVNHARFVEDENKLKTIADIIKKEEDQEEAALKKFEAAEKRKAHIIKRESEKIEKEREHALEKEKHAIEKQTEQWKQAGAAIGGALTNALATALEQLQSGGEVDATAITADILSAVVATAVSLIPGFGGFAGIAGQLTKVGVNAIGTAAGGGPKRRRHDGGWAGDGMSRYHLGTWVGPDEEAAILQNGERVVSRSEVSAMGGPRGVEKAINGRGGGGVVNIQTFDAGSFREIFSGRAGRGLLNAARTGNTVPAALFGGR